MKTSCYKDENISATGMVQHTRFDGHLLERIVQVTSSINPLIGGHATFISIVYFRRDIRRQGDLTIHSTATKQQITFGA